MVWFHEFKKKKKVIVFFLDCSVNRILQYSFYLVLGKSTEHLLAHPMAKLFYLPIPSFLAFLSYVNYPLLVGSTVVVIKLRF